MKRMWMLLLAVMALSVLLAVPAMAAEEHVHGTCGDTTCCTHNGWTVLKADTTFTDGGKYYVPEGGLEVNFEVPEGVSVTICLNGQKWTGDTNRPLTVNKKATVDIVDCSAQDETTKLSGGKLIGIDVTTNTTPSGGTLYVSNGGVVNIYNGTLTGGTAGSGGNVYMTTASSQLNVYGGLIADGAARVGGNIYVSNGTLTVDGANAVISAGSTTKDITAVNSDPNGGNIWQSSGTIKLKDGTIKDGVSVGTAGNVRVGGIFEMSGGTIINGAAGATPSMTASSANMQIVGPGLSVSFSGGHAHGYISVYNTKAIKVSGSAKVYAADEAGTILNNGGIELGYATTTTEGVTTVSRDCYLVIDGTLNSDAKIAVTKTVGQKVLAPVGTADEWRAYEAYLRNGQIGCSNTSRTVTFEADGMYSRTSSTSEVWHCYCGYVNGKHDRGCNEYDVKWTAWSGGNITTSGNYFLTKDLTGQGCAVIKGGTCSYRAKDKATAEIAIEVVLDLNGHDLTTAATGSRALQVYPDANFTLCNSKARESVVTGTGNSGENYGVFQFIGFHNTVAMLDRVTLQFDNTPGLITNQGVVGVEGTFIMYGGTIKGDVKSDYTKLTKAGAVMVSGGTYSYTDGDTTYTGSVPGNFIMYENAEIYGGNVTGGGGAVYMSGSNARFTMNGGKIYGSTVTTSGGAIFIDGGIFTAEQGATITALDEDGNVIGNAKNGAAAYVSGTGELILDNSTMIGGNTTNTGAVLYMDGGTFTARNGSVITGGTSTASAGALSLSGGVFTLDGSTIHGGTAPTGGAVHVWAYNNKSGTFIMQNGATVNGGNVTNGGAVNVSGGSFTCYGGTINGSTVSGKGGAVCVTGGTFNLYNGTIQGGKSAPESGDAMGGNVYLSGGTFNAIPNPDGAGANDKREITGGLASGSADYHGKGGNFYVVGGSLNLNATTVSGGVAEYTGTAAKYGYGGNIFVNNSSATVALSNGTVISGGISRTTSTWAPGGNIMMESGKLTIDGKNTTITGGKSVTKMNQTTPGVSDSHNLYINSTGEVTMNDGRIENTVDGAANILIQGGKLTVKGGELVVTSENTRNINTNNNPSGTAEGRGMLTIEGGKIHGGNSTAHGGNINLCARVNFTMSGGEIYDGTSETSGGNIYFQGTANLTVSEVTTTFVQEIGISGGKIYNGNATNHGGNIYVGAGAVVTVSGGEISGGTANKLGGGMYMNGASLTMSGAPKITGNTTSNLYLPKDKVITIGEGGLTAGADVGVTCADAAAGRDVTGAVEEFTTAIGIGSDDGQYAVRYNSTDKVMELSTDLSGALVNGAGTVLDLATAISLAGETDFVQLTGNYESDVTIDKNLYLDLNGYTISGNVTVSEGYKLKLFDTATADYSVDKDANGMTYGKITGTITGDIERTMNTPKATYGGNYRYVVIKDEEGYHSHRFYMSVQSTVLYPTRPALNYRTVLRCDAVVAKYINAEGGAYGVRVMGWDTKEGAYTQEDGVTLVTYGAYTTAVNQWDGSDDNNRVSQLVNILSTSDTLEQQIYKAETVQMHACAYFLLADQFGGEEIVSSTVKKSMMDMVKAADAMTGLSKVQMATLGAMYTSYSALMARDTWSLSNIPNYNQGNLEYYCLCGDPTSTNNPCAAKGHMAVAWEPWEKTDSLPTEEGNWYLTDHVTLKNGQLDLLDQQFICIDTRGFGITSTNRIALVCEGAVLNLVNSSDTESVLTAKGVAYNNKDGGDSGALLILDDGNVSIYDGIKITLTDDHVVGKGGVASVHGDLNIYGGTLVGTKLIREKVTIDTTERDYTAQSGNGNGGAVIVTKNGYLFMNNGTIIGGQDAGAGSAIYSNGTVDIRDGAILQAGTAANGALLAITGGSFNLTGLSLTGGTATSMGGAVYISAGELTLSGTTLDGGAAPRGGAIAAQGTAIVNVVDESTVCNGTAVRNTTDNNYGFGANFFVAGTAQVNIAGSSVSGGRMSNFDNSGNGDQNDYGGSAFYVSGGTVTVTDSTLSGYTDENFCKRGGTVLMKGGSFRLVNSTISAAKATTNGAAVYMNSGSFEMDGKNAAIHAEDITCTYGSTVSMTGSASFTMKDGTIYGGTTKGYGDTHAGAVQMYQNTTFTMSGGTITGGRHTNASYSGGGNVLVAGTAGKCTFKMTDGTITGGSSTTLGGNIYVKTGTFDMSGGTITGGTATGNGGGLYADTGVVKLSGTAQITGNATSNVYLADEKLLTLGALTDGANVGVTLASDVGFLSEAADANADNLSYVHSDKSWDKGYDSETKQLYIGKLSCLCGAYGGEEHIGQCQDEKLFWTPWTDTKNMPKTTGYWYLTQDEYTPGGQAQIGYNTAEDVDVVLDLNGKTVTGATNIRVFSLWTNSENGNYSLTITDSSEGHEGIIRPVSSDTNTNQGMGVWLRGSHCTFNLYRGTIDAAKVKLCNSVNETTKVISARNGTAIDSSGTVNMYGGTIIGGTTEGNGGAVNTSGTFTMSGGSIYGGTATGYVGYKAKASGTWYETEQTESTIGHNSGDGGNIRNTGTMTITGGSIYGGTAYSSGGNIENTGTLTISGTAQIYNGTASGGSTDYDNGYGGNICNSSGTLNITGLTIRGGTATQGSKGGGGLGGNIVANGIVNLTGVTLTGGNAYTGGNLGTNGTSANVTLDGVTITGGTATDMGGNIAVNVRPITGFTIKGDSSITGGSAKNGGNIGASMWASGGKVSTITMESGTVSGGTATVNGGNVYLTSSNASYVPTFVMTGGTVSGGAAGTSGNGNNIYFGSNTKGSLGGSIINTVDGTSDKIANNIYVSSSSSDVTVTGGVIENKLNDDGTYGIFYARNVYMSNGLFNMTGGEIRNGYGAERNGGNVFVSKGTFKLAGGTIRDGVTGDTGGNIYLNGQVNISGGLVTGGIASMDADGKGSTEHNAANIQCVNGELTISGGEITGGVNVNNYDTETATAENNFLVLSGSPKITGSGINLTSGSETDENKVTTIYSLPYLDFTGLNADAVVHISSDRTYWTNQGVKIYSDTESDVYKNKVFVECLPDTCQVAYLEDGVYLYNAQSYRYSCVCGANAGEEHLGDCTGEEVPWSAWNVDEHKSLPYIPGHWFITTSQKDPEYLALSEAATFNRDYYKDEDGTWQRTYRCDADEDGNLYDEPLFFDANAKNQISITQEDVVENIDVFIDLNGYKIQSVNNNRALSGLASYTISTPVVSTDDVAADVTSVKRTYTRSAQLNVSISDSSQGHLGALACYGTYSNQTYANSGVPQGSLIWIPNAGDTLKTYRVELDASNATQGWGLALYTKGIVDLYETDIIGGTAAGYFKSTDTVYTANGVQQSAVSVKTVAGSEAGGGAVCIVEDAVVTMHGGSITGGTAKYDYLEGDNGIGYDRVYGGGNVFISGGTFTMNGGIISGGKAIINSQAAAADNHEPGSTYGVGGGVYVYGGTFNVSGDAKITGNTGADGAASNVFLNGHPVNVIGALSSGASIGIDMTTYEGTYATTTVEANKAYFVCDDGGSGTGTFDSTDGKLYFATGNASTYLVGYGSASIQPSDTDLAAGLSLNGYGNTTQRTTNLLTLDQHHAATAKYNNEMLATALAITDAEGDTVILLNVDMSSAGSTAVNKAKNLIHQATGVPMDNITVASSHQHSSPSVTTTYWQNSYGEYTKADGTTVLKPNEARVIKTDYATTFYKGVVEAAVAAFKDRKQSAVSVGTLDTTSGGNQYNFVRNVKIMSGSTMVGMWTDNHTTHYQKDGQWYGSLRKATVWQDGLLAGLNGNYVPDEDTLVANSSLAYESEMDTTMQLVKFTQEGGTDIVLANFQTHPHLAGSSTSYYVHSDVVGAFRNHLNVNTGARVIYFSGASGDVNTSTKITADEAKYPYSGVTLTESEASLKRIERAEIYGDKLADLAASFLTTDGNMKAQSGSTDVEVMVKEVEYEMMKNTASDVAIEHAKMLVDWETGSYLGDPTTFSNYWNDFVGYQSNEADRVYSFYHASRIRSRLLNESTGKTTGSITLTAYSLGSIGFTAAPYEMFQLNGQQLKAQSTAAGNYVMTIVSTIANGGSGYIPTSEAYDNGGYSTDISPFAKGTGEQMVSEFVGMLNALKGGN